MEEGEINLLKSIGLTDGELKVYNLLLKKDSLKAGQISKITQLNRSHLYKILDSLIQKKLVFSSILDHTMIFGITRVERIKEIYYEHLNKLKDKEDEIINLVTNIKGRGIGSLESSFSIEVYEGVNEIKSVLKDILSLTKYDKICALGKEGILSEFPGIKYWFDNLLRERVKRGIKFYAVYNFHEKAKMAKSALTFVRYANLKNIGDIEIAFYSDKLLIYLMEKERPRVIVLKNQMIKNIMDAYFNLLWEKGQLK
ncbi:MAG: TrmB family transcriptional regulator [Candidatus Nanoarchaeia archaeon]